MDVKLSKREQEVLTCICQGMADKQIASKLVLAPTTVHAYVQRVFQKTKTHNRVQAAVYAIRHDLVDLGGLEDGQEPAPEGY